MNLVGKIFTVLIFLMCVVFASFGLMVHAAHKNWKEEANKASDELTKAAKEKQDLLDEKQILQTKLDDEKKDHEKRLLSLDERRKQAEADRDRYEGQVREKENTATQLSLAIHDIEKRVTVLQTTIKGMRDDIQLTVDDRNSLRTKLLSTTDDLQTAVNEKARLEKLQVGLAKQIIELNSLVKTFKITLGDLNKTPPTGLEGEVLSVPRSDIAVISVGADDGVRKGHKFVVTRPSAGGKYIGMIEVYQADDGNRCVCRTDSKSLNDQIQVHDHVKAYDKPR